jgi:hypothetical protein
MTKLVKMTKIGKIDPKIPKVRIPVLLKMDEEFEQLEKDIDLLILSDLRRQRIPPQIQLSTQELVDGHLAAPRRYSYQWLKLMIKTCQA